MSALILTLAVMLSTSLQTGAENPGSDWGSAHFSPSTLMLGGYGDMLSGSWSREGVLDSGQVMARFVSMPEATPLELTNLKYGKGPQLWAEAEGMIGDVEFRSVALGIPQTAQGDKRLILASQIRLVNPTSAPVQVQLGAELFASHDSRIHGSVAFETGATWTLDGRTLLKDGRAAAGWVGPTPQVELAASADEPGDPAATFVWTLDIPAGGTTFLEIKLAGNPPSDASGDAQDEAAWRAVFDRRAYAYLEESDRWRSQSRGRVTTMEFRSDMMLRVLGSSVHTLRQQGQAGKFQAEQFSDNPYGAPATDVAAEAEILAALTEFGLEEFISDYVARMLGEIPQALATLDDERKVVYLHSLARIVRLHPLTMGSPELAQAIVALGDPDVAVEPWHDPRVVRQDMLGVVAALGLPTEGLLSRLRWPELEEGSVAHLMQSARRAIAKREGDVAWVAMQQLFKAATTDGMGSMDGRNIDGRYALGMLAVGRAALIDDHGDSLNLFPGNCSGLVTRGTQMDTTWMRTAFGLVRGRSYFTGKALAGAWILFKPEIRPERMTVTFPAGLHVRNIKGSADESDVELVGDRLAEIHWPEVIGGPGVRFLARVTDL